MNHKGKTSVLMLTDRSVLCYAIFMNTKEKILNAAIKVFASNGYHGSSISDIAKKAQVSKALFYHYFESKRDLLVIFAKKRLEEWSPLILQLETIMEPFKRVCFVIDFVLDELEEKPDWLRFLYMLYLSEEGVKAISLAMKKYAAQFNRLFAAEIKLFEDLGFENPQSEAIYLRSMLQGISLEYLLSGGNYPLQAMKDKIKERYKT